MERKTHKRKLCDDAANVNWGGDWRIPTKKEQRELTNDSYFLPAVGSRSIFSSGEGYLGCYGSNYLNKRGSDSALSMRFNIDDMEWSSIDRYEGLSVRSVRLFNNNN